MIDYLHKTIDTLLSIICPIENKIERDIEHLFAKNSKMKKYQTNKKHSVIVRNKYGTLQETSERRTPNDENEEEAKYIPTKIKPNVKLHRIQ